MHAKDDAPIRTVTEVGTGDFVKVGSQWKRVVSNTAAGAEHTPRSWTVTTEGGGTYSMFDVNRYAKAEDMQS